ncbi:MAG: thermonuclease family protein [Pseudomonadota bacterium]
MPKATTMLAACGLLATGGLAADGLFNTSYSARVERVIDGDTVEVVVDLAPGMSQTVDVRERDLDTPEKRRGRFGAQCEAERELGLKVSALVTDTLAEGTAVRIDNVGLGKYAGRWVGDIRFALDGRIVDLGDWLIGQGLAVHYDGGTKRKVWCKNETRLPTTVEVK